MYYRRYKDIDLKELSNKIIYLPLKYSLELKHLSIAQERLIYEEFLEYYLQSKKMPITPYTMMIIRRGIPFHTLSIKPKWKKS